MSIEIRRNGTKNEEYENFIHNIPYFSFLLTRRINDGKKDTKIVISNIIIESTNKWKTVVIIGPFINLIECLNYSNKWVNSRGLQSKCRLARQLSVEFNVKIQIE